MEKPDRPAFTTIIARGWSKRCPHCGVGPLFVKSIDLHEKCSHCGITYLRNNGDYWGFLLIMDRALFILPLIFIIYFDLLPKTDWTIAIFFVTVMGLFIATAGRRYGLCVGLDYLSRYFFGESSDIDSAN